MSEVSGTVQCLPAGPVCFQRWQVYGPISHAVARVALYQHCVFRRQTEEKSQFPETRFACLADYYYFFNTSAVTLAWKLR